MQNKKSSKADIGRNSSLYFAVGLALMMFLSYGTINYKAQINGQIGNNMNPNLFIEYELKNGVFETKKYPFFLNEISCKGTIENGPKNNFTSSKVTFNNFLAKSKKGKIAGNFNLLNLQEYYLQANFSSES